MTHTAGFSYSWYNDDLNKWYKQNPDAVSVPPKHLASTLCALQSCCRAVAELTAVRAL